MEEIIARGKREKESFDYKKFVLITAIAAVTIMLLGIISSISEASEYWQEHEHTRYCYEYRYRDDFYEDSRNNDLKSYKMDCPYTGTPFSRGLKNYFEGGIILPIIVAAAGATFILVKHSRSKGYELTVTNESVRITYSDGKTQEVPLCSIFMLEKAGANDLIIITSENTFKLSKMEGRDEVYTGINDLLPDISIKGPTNNEQVLAKGYPPAVKPWLLVLVILFALVTVIAAIASEMPAIFVIGLIPTAIAFAFYWLAKTPYLVVTDKRVFYVSDFGRKLSLPMNKITVTVTHRWFRQLHIAAATGSIHLFGVRNTADLYDVIVALLNEKQ